MAKIKAFLKKWGVALAAGFMGFMALVRHDVVLGMLVSTSLITLAICATSRPGVNVHIVHEGEAPEKLEPKEEK